MAEESIRATLHVDNNFTISYIHRLRKFRLINRGQRYGRSNRIGFVGRWLCPVHFLSPWYFTPIASNWSAMDDTISITFWVTGLSSSPSICSWPMP